MPNCIYGLTGKSENGKYARSIVLATILALCFTMACQVEQTREAQLPDVDVEVDPGQLPKWDIDGPDVDVGVTETTVTIPKLVVVEEEEVVSVPFIDIDVPGAEREKRTITVEVEVPKGGYDVEIQEIYAKGAQLWVISSLERSGGDAQGVTRVSDRVVLNAPEEVDVRHYIVGQRPTGSHNEQYRFIGSKMDIQSNLGSARLVYSRSGSVSQEAGG